GWIDSCVAVKACPKRCCLTKRCCRTNFPLRLKFAAERGVMQLEKNMGSFEIDFANLWTYEGDSSDERLPLSQLSESGGHIHGLLQIKVNGTVLPRLGFFGPDDVCFNEWVFTLRSALRELSDSTSTSYTYGEGEQGQPAFLFERDGDAAFLSIVAS